MSKAGQALRPTGSPGRLQVNRTQLVTLGRALVSEVLGVKGGVLGLQTARLQADWTLPAGLHWKLPDTRGSALSPQWRTHITAIS